MAFIKPTILCVVFLSSATSYAESLSGEKVLEVLREKDAVFYASFSVTLAGRANTNRITTSHHKNISDITTVRLEVE